MPNQTPQPAKTMPELPAGNRSDMADAWLAVTSTLNEVFPQWIESSGIGRDAACDAIRFLAQSTAAAAGGREVTFPDEPLKVFDRGPWNWTEIGQQFTGLDLDGAAFAAYRDYFQGRSSAIPLMEGESWRDYENRYATRERLAKPPATAKCDFCGASPGELHAFDCSALDDPSPASPPVEAVATVGRHWTGAVGFDLNFCGPMPPYGTPLYAAPQARGVIREALEKVIAAVGEYLPPDGISQEALISKVIEATDNPELVRAMK